jgi:Methyltransferase domain
VNLPSNTPARWGPEDVAAVRTGPFFGGPDLPWSDWAMRPSAIAVLVDEMRSGPREVVELGGGVSTVVLARAARELGARIVSVEHNAAWAEEIRGLLRRERLDAARVVDVPLAELDAAEVTVPSEPTLRAPGKWYELGALRDACPEAIELLVIDGPPAAESPDVLIRAPALPALRGRLAEGCTVALDDVSRPAERRAAELWQHALGCELELPPDTDLGVLRR